MKKDYFYTLYVSPEEREKLSSILIDPKWEQNEAFAPFGIDQWTCKVRLTREDLIILKLKVPEVYVSRTYLSKKARFTETMKFFGIEVENPEEWWKSW